MALENKNTNIIHLMILFLLQIIKNIITTTILSIFQYNCFTTISYFSSIIKPYNNIILIIIPFSIIHILILQLLNIIIPFSIIHITTTLKISLFLLYYSYSDTTTIKYHYSFLFYSDSDTTTILLK